MNPWKNDIREHTYLERVKIGYKFVRDAWITAPAHFSEEALKISGHPVMERWEDNYMKALAEIATANGGVILEVGFGMGISAGYIQKHDIDRHIIIEANKDVFAVAEEFAARAKYPVAPMFGFWEDEVAKIKAESISGILFDTYPLSEEEVHKNHFNFFAAAWRMLRPGGVLTYYSDEISDFSSEHRRCLEEAGFKKINGQICEIKPPKDCQYWKSNTMLAPIVTK